MTASSSSSPTRSDSPDVELRSDHGDGSLFSRVEAHEVQVHLSTDLPEVFQLPDHPFVVPSNFSRLELSRLVNQLLQQQNEEEWSGYQPFDFLVDAQWFLRTSLQKYMDDRGMTAEVPLNLHYQLAVRHLDADTLPPTRDWISSLTSIPSEAMLMETSYDGRCRLYRVSRSSSSSPSSSHARPMLEVAMHQGPLTAGAAFAAGAFLPPHCMQLIVGSKGGALSVLNTWSESAPCSRKEEESKCSGGPEVSSIGSWHAELQCVGCQDSSVLCVGLSTDGVTIASGGADGTVLLWENFETLTEAANRAEERAKEEEAVVELNAQGKPKRKRGPQRHGDSNTQQLDPKLRLSSNHTEAVTDVAFAPPPFRCVLFSGSLDGTISAWDTLVGGDPLSTWTTPRAITSLTCSPTNGRVVCTAHEDGRIRLWDVRSGDSEVSSLIEPMKSSSTSKSVTTPDTNTRLDLRFAFGFPHRRLATQVRWSPRGAKGDAVSEHLISSVGQDGALRILDVRAPSTPLLVLDISNGKEKKPVRLLTCTWCDTGRIAAGGSDGVTRIHTIGARWTG